MARVAPVPGDQYCHKDVGDILPLPKLKTAPLLAVRDMMAEELVRLPQVAGLEVTRYRRLCLVNHRHSRGGDE